jgi:hypothetical protein
MGFFDWIDNMIEGLNKFYGNTHESIIEEDLRNQVSDRGVKYLIDHIHEIRIEVLAFVEPGTEVFPEQAFFVGNVIAEFKNDSNLGIVHGQGGGHAFFRVKFLKEILIKHQGQINNYPSLVRAFKQEGHKIKRVPFIRFETTIPQIPKLKRKGFPKPFESRNSAGIDEERLDSLVQELIRIGQGGGVSPGFIDTGYIRSGYSGNKIDTRTIEIGEQLCEMGGINLMREIYARVASELSLLSIADLADAWEGIGGWDSEAEYPPEY